MTLMKIKGEIHFKWSEQGLFGKEFVVYLKINKKNLSVFTGERKA